MAKYVIVFVGTASRMHPDPRSIGREDLGEVTKEKARKKLLSRTRAMMKEAGYVGGAYLIEER